MTFQEFHNGLRLLRRIDRHEVPAFVENYGEWARFLSDPFHYFISADDKTAQQIWSAMQKNN